MAQTARYLFDLDFAAPPEPEVEEFVEEIPPEPMITVAEHEQLLQQARQESFAQGEQKARDDRELLANEEKQKLQQTILNDVGMIYTEVGLLLERLEKDASQLAFAFASRFAEKLVAQEPKTEILALLHQILAPLRQTPHISIRLNDAVAEEIKTEIDEQMNALGFEGKITILPDPVVMPGDCEVEWQDGGIGRNLRAAVRQAEKLLDDHFAHVPDEADDETDDEQVGDEDQSNLETEAGSEEELDGSDDLEKDTPEMVEDAEVENDASMEPHLSGSETDEINPALEADHAGLHEPDEAPISPEGEPDLDGEDK